MAAARTAKGLSGEASSSSLVRFELEIDWIKALPGGWGWLCGLPCIPVCLPAHVTG